MIFEGFCKYSLNSNDATLFVIELSFSNLGTPLLPTEFLVTKDKKVLLFENKYLKYKTGKQSRCFVINTDQMKIERFDSILGLTEIKYEDGLKYYYKIKIKKDEFIGVLSSITVVKRENDCLFRNTPSLEHIIQCEDGVLYIEPDILKTGHNLSNEIQGKQDCSHTPEISLDIEQLNIPDHGVLIKSYIKHIINLKIMNNSNSFFYIAVLNHKECFYFTFYKCEDSLLVLISRYLFDFILLFNLIIETQFEVKILQIRDLGCISGLIKDINLLVPFEYGNVDNQNSQIIITKIFKNKKVLIKKGKLWDIELALHNIRPFVFPGLIASPLLKEMEYLLDGPYLLIACDIESDLPSKISNINHIKSLIGSTNIFSGSSNRDVSGSRIPSFTELLRDKYYLIKSQQYNFSYLKRSNCIEEVCLNWEVKFHCDYFYCFETRQEILKKQIINYKDSLKLWIIFYKKDINKELILKDHKDDRKIMKHLMMRTMIDDDREFIYKILNEISQEDGIEIMNVIGNYEDLRTKLKRCQEYQIKYRGKTGVSEYIELEAKGNEIVCHRLYKDQNKGVEAITIENVLGCLSHGCYDEVVDNLGIYFGYSNLPVD